MKSKALRLRYDRVLEAMPAVPSLVTDFLAIDNSHTSFQLIARWKSGQLVRLRAKVPAWAQRVFFEPFDDFRKSRQPHQI